MLTDLLNGQVWSNAAALVQDLAVDQQKPLCRVAGVDGSRDLQGRQLAAQFTARFSDAVGSRRGGGRLRR